MARKGPAVHPQLTAYRARRTEHSGGIAVRPAFPESNPPQFQLRNTWE